MLVFGAQDGATLEGGRRLSSLRLLGLGFASALVWPVVFRGEMSIVGPRPPVPVEVAEYETFERRRLSMRPGITCLWQVRGRNAIGFEGWVRLDLEYIDTWSLSNDLKILMRTVPAVLSGDGAS